MKTLFEWSKWGGLIGIGISMMFLLTVEHALSDVRIWFYYILFGLIVGVLITTGNLIFTETICGKFPTYSKLFLLVQLVIRYIVSSALFYLTASIYRTYIYSFFPNHQIVMGTSLAVGIASVMVGLFWGYAAEKDERIKLEIENRKLAVVEERNRIARELHDAVSQNLFGISLNINTLKYTMKQNPEQTSKMIDELLGMVAEIQNEMRLMIYELQPVALIEKGLFEALENLAGLFRKRYNLEINCSFSGNDGELEGDKQLVIYRVIQESLNNVVRHSEAGKVKIVFEIKDGHGELTVRDDGKGFDLAEQNNKTHLGIRGMRERAVEAGGEFKIESAHNEGTKVLVYV